MFEIFKNFDTLKSQTTIGILSGIIIILLLILPYLVGKVKGSYYNVPKWVAGGLFYILSGFAIVLLLLGGLNFVKGYKREGITAIFFGLLWFFAIWFSMSINWEYEDRNFSVCLSAVSPFK
ncbi:hypothetical protein QKU48_gp0198 [Fadolivirus algeromassiliense]|jgi:quinol-cytochrome oxidoreductase complex cytochrome b subunit|uniref:Uncharacterized protein n=1 Tax=Fadolivirus FV1/VV64 TaxID=3070911 RepID=A0A7D3V7B5_9VIRU|nr:hypothetical protein QKU48_gp0198 [Fadolivirus algeromassiliense]QKF93656.1 hypothetical protein Fadolivirus_1_198 [Fadolivirus FV1/VV64]